jgi:chromosome segregation ATPase
LLALK